MSSSLLLPKRHFPFFDFGLLGCSAGALFDFFFRPR
jgi:hypothetical protein